ncbi:MAG TPA: TolC family protein, partial [Rhodopila sp.]|nr:TolC family protein [Rhodopila sp.]
MGLRHGLLASFSLVALAASAGAQTLPQSSAPQSSAPQSSAPLSTPPRALARPTPPPAKAAPTQAPTQAQVAPRRPNKPAAQSVSGIALPRTLIEALAATYANQPALQAERARLRATDENVPTALAGWRPTVVMAGTAGYGDGVTREYLTTSFTPTNVKIRNPRDIATAQATVTQNIYTGGKIAANVNRSKNQVMAERATLIAQEQTSFNNA